MAVSPRSAGWLSGMITLIVLPNVRESSPEVVANGVAHFQDCCVVAKLCSLGGLTIRINEEFFRIESRVFLAGQSERVELSLKSK